MSYQNTNEEGYKNLCVEGTNLWNECIKYREELGWNETNLNELASFISFTFVYPKSSLLLVDTYNTIHSGVKNFLLVALALRKINIQPVGIRLDSGDLALISKYIDCYCRESRKLFVEIGQRYNYPEFKNLVISASNDINESSLNEFNQKV
jgi:nicotinate phosphoribosyltransferase